MIISRRILRRDKKECKILIRKLEMEHDFMWENNFKMGARITGCNGEDSIHLIQDKV